jgi:hypothetical protein
MRAPVSGPFSSNSQPLVVAVATVLAIGPATGHPGGSFTQITEGIPQQTPRAARPAPDVTQILAGARAVLGDVTRVRTFTATGHTRPRRGGRSPVAFEIAAELPDRYVRVDAAPIQGGAQTRSGFNGDDLIQRPAPPPPRTPASSPGVAPLTQMDAMRRARVTVIKQDFARLLLGMFGSSMGAYPLTFSYGGSGEAPQGRADIVEARGAANLALRFLIYQDTHLPAMITWPVPTEGQAVENRLIFSDYRDVDGLRLPFRYERAAGPEVVEETIVERYRINVRIDPRTFDVPK